MTDATPDALPAPERTRSWRVVRYVREEYEVEASSRVDALAAVQDPHTVSVTRETCVEVKARAALARGEG